MSALETAGAPRSDVRSAELWLGGALVALLALAYLAGPGLDARMTGDSMRDFIRLRDCPAAAQAAGRYCDLGTGASAGHLMHGTLWMRLLVLATYQLGLSAATQAAAMSAAVALATGVVFALMRPFGSRSLALWTAAVFLALTGPVGFPDFTNGYMGFLPSAVLFLALSRVGAGSGLGWYAAAGLALYPCIEAHVSSFVLLPVLLWVTAASSGPAVSGTLVAVASLLTPAMLWSRMTYGTNLVADPPITCALLGACLFVLLLARLTRARWQKLALEVRLGATAMATILGAYFVGWLAMTFQGWPENPYYLIPLLVPIAGVVTVASQAGLRMIPGISAKIAVAASLCVVAWNSRPPFLIPIVAAAVGLLLLSGWTSLRGSRALPVSEVRASPLTTNVLNALVCGFWVVTLIGRYGAWTNAVWSGEATIASAQALSSDLRSHGWTCQQARLAQGLSVWTDDRRLPFECVLLEGGGNTPSPESVAVRIVPAARTAVPKAGIPGWDSVDLGHGRLALVSGLAPWIRQDRGTGQVIRGENVLARFNIVPLWQVGGRRDWEDVFNTDYPIILSRLVPGIDSTALAGATARFDFPIVITGSDPQHEIDVSNEARPRAGWRIAAIQGVEHALDPSGLHATLRRGDALSGSISLTRVTTGDPESDDSPIELLETTPNEAPVRALFIRTGERIGG